MLPAELNKPICINKVNKTEDLIVDMDRVFLTTQERQINEMIMNKSIIKQYGYNTYIHTTI